jgi:ornithine carbamoyltransferase
VNFLSVLDFDHETLDACLALAASMKRDRALGRRAPTADALGGRHVALLFEKPSLRTRCTFEIAIRELGGEALSPGQDAVFGGRESVADVARNLERWVAAAVVRTFAQRRLEALADAAPRLRVINALTDEEHPCQALADVQTLQERWGELRGRTVAFVGDGNNVATSLVQAVVMLGADAHVASPEGFELPDEVMARAQRVARSGAQVRRFRDPGEAVRDAGAVYTDVWASMGQEAQAASRQAAFERYQVNAELMAQAPEGALFMHCLPAHRGQEVTDDVIDSPTSVVFDQAENRLHAQKALLHLLVAGRD